MLRRLFESIIPRKPAKRRRQRVSPCLIQPLEPRLLLSTISGRVWLDANINGIQDAQINGMESEFEDGIAGIVVQLYKNDTFESSITTDSDGLFSFTGLDQGTYYLKYATSAKIDGDAFTFDEVQGTEHHLTLKNAEYGDANLPTMDSDASTVTGQTADIVLGTDETVDDQGAGYARIFTLVSPIAVVVGQEYDFELNFALPDYLTGYPTTFDWDDTVNEGDPEPTVTQQSSNDTQGDIVVTIDFDTYDQNHFFDLDLTADAQRRRDLLQYAASTIVNRFGDTLSAIEPDVDDPFRTWYASFIKPDEAEDTSIQIDNLEIDLNELLIFTGSADLETGVLAKGGSGGYGSDADQLYSDFIYDIIGRDQEGITTDSSTNTDFASWGGTIRFDNDTDWYYGLDTDDIEFDQSDFLSTAMHELLHVLGFGLADSWNNLIDVDVTYNYQTVGSTTYKLVSGTFTGDAASSIYPGGVPLNEVLDIQNPQSPTVVTTYPDHFATDITAYPDSGEEVSMDENIILGTRKLPTVLDYAVMDDIGWELLDESSVSNDGSVIGTHTYNSTGTKTITFTIVISDNEQLTYELEIQVVDAAYVQNVEVNAANFAEDADDPALDLLTPNFSSSIQRSVLKSVVFTFSREMQDISTSDLVLKIIYQDGTTYEPELNDATVTTDDNITFILDLTGMELSDGVYELTIKETVVDVIALANLDADYVSDRFHQLGGDFNGDTKFNAADLGAVLYYWNGNHANPPAYLNVDDTGDSQGIVDASDLSSLATWQASLNINVQELVVESLVAQSPSSQPNNMALALAAYQAKQASLKLVQADYDSGDTVEYEDLIGQWLE
jgi:hypothetical protein